MGFREGDTFRLEYKAFAERYGIDYIEAPTSQIVLATPEQVSEIKKLLEVVKVDPKDIEKIFSKANADSWEELTTEHAGVTISWLKKKGTV